MFALLEDQAFWAGLAGVIGAITALAVALRSNKTAGETRTKLDQHLNGNPPPGPEDGTGRPG